MIVSLAKLILMLAPKLGENLEESVHGWRDRGFGITGEAVVQGVLRATIGAIDLFVAPGLPWRARLLRTGAASVLLLVGALGISGLIEGKPFGLTQTPWVAYSEALEVMLERELTAEEPDMEAVERVRSWAQLHWVAAYSLLSIGAVLLLSFLGDFASLHLSRSILFGLRSTDSKGTVFAALLGLATVLLVVAMVVFFFVACTSSPYLIAPLVVTGMLFDNSLLGGGIGVIGTFVLAAYLVRPWVWAVAATAVLPGLFVLGMWALGGLLAPFARPTGRILGHVLEVAVSHRSGVVGFLITLLSGLAAILGGVLYLWPGP